MKTKFRLISDTHLDCSKLDLPKHEDDCVTILIIAGDLCETVNTPIVKKHLEKWCNQFYKVVYVFGNHDYYKAQLIKQVEIIREKFSYIENLIILDNQTHIENDIVIIGATLWTNYDNLNPVAMIEANFGMYDYMAIHDVITIDGVEKKVYITPERLFVEFDNSARYIFSEIEKHKADGKKVLVVTHHAPSQWSVGSKFLRSKLNPAFYSSLDQDILNSQPDYWVHGHMHEFKDYMIGNTRIIVNPRGYVGSRGIEYTGWKPELSFEL